MRPSRFLSMNVADVLARQDRHVFGPLGGVVVRIEEVEGDGRSGSLALLSCRTKASVSTGSRYVSNRDVSPAAMYQPIYQSRRRPSAFLLLANGILTTWESRSWPERDPQQSLLMFIDGAKPESRRKEREPTLRRHVCCVIKYLLGLFQ